MRFLADESCDFVVVRALRAAGHDVRAVAEVDLGATDDVVLEIASREQRVLLTEDKDFGQLVFAAGTSTRGVVFIRYPATARFLLPQVVVDLVNTEQERRAGAFVVVHPSRIRISRGPTGES
jgi:predicted nuclease of predicted toxin-antitoxin system